MRKQGQQRVNRDTALQYAAQIAFTYWRDGLGKREDCIFDTKRERRLLARLRENGGNISELLFAVDGARKDDWIMGRDPKSTRKFDGIEVIFRDREQVERLAELGGMNGVPHPYLESSPA